MCKKIFYLCRFRSVCSGCFPIFFFLPKKFVFPADFLLIPSERFNILSNLLYAHFGKVMWVISFINHNKQRSKALRLGNEPALPMNFVFTGLFRILRENRRTDSRRERNKGKWLACILCLCIDKSSKGTYMSIKNSVTIATDFVARRKNDAT